MKLTGKQHWRADAKAPDTPRILELLRLLALGPSIAVKALAGLEAELAGVDVGLQ